MFNEKKVNGMTLKESYVFIEPAEKALEALIDDTYESVSICGIEFSPGQILKELDPIAFRCALLEQPEQWQCLICEEIHDNEDDAASCCFDDFDDDDYL